MARKAVGSEVKETRSVRIEPKKRNLIAKAHGTFQKWIDAQVEAEVAKLKGKKVISTPMTKLPPKVKAQMKAKAQKLVDEMF